MHGLSANRRHAAKTRDPVTRPVLCELDVRSDLENGKTDFSMAQLAYRFNVTVVINYTQVAMKRACDAESFIIAYNKDKLVRRPTRFYPRTTTPSSMSFIAAR